MSFLKKIFANTEELEAEMQNKQQELSALQSKLERLWRFLPIAVCEINAEGIIKEGNDEFFRLFNIYKEGNYHKQLSDLFIEKGSFEEFLKNQNISNQGFAFYDTENKRIYLQVYKTHIDGSTNTFVCFDNISEVKNLKSEMEEKIRIRIKDIEDSRVALLNMLEDTEEARARVEEEKVKTETIFTNFVDGLLVFDLNQELNLINSEAEKFLNISGAKFIGKNFSELKKEKNLGSLFSILGNDMKEMFRKELIISPDLILEVTSVFITAGKKKISFLVIMHDVTRERFIEDLKSQFVTVAAHQLRTPLSIIKWGLGMLLGGDVGKISTDQKDLLGKTFQTNERMIKLVNDLLNVSKIEEGKYLYQPKIIDMEALIRQICASSQEMIIKRNIDLAVEIDGSKSNKTIKADEEKMTLAIKNLLDNAISYTEAQGKITIKLSGEKGKIRISVSDTGVGIPAKQQDRVFSKFFRGSNVVKMDTDGTGLGLFITKNIIEAHGGEISFKSKEGEGTTFLIVLPVAD
ncbi:MAG: HAMP domain-containing sensor histidine kinase [Candidatus Paceibacterota bacterium]|jgi:signal transduction histidine kinase